MNEATRTLDMPLPDDRGTRLVEGPVTRDTPRGQGGR